MKDFARIAQLSAEEAFRLLLEKSKDDQANVWLRFESELAKRVADLRERHKDELHAARSEKDHLTRRAEDYLREVGQLRERNQELEAEMSKVARVGRKEEMDFADEARTWAGIALSEKLARNGDYVLSFRDVNGAPFEPRMLVDNKDKSIISEGDIDKLVRDSKERSISIAILVTRTEEQLRQVDKEARWSRKDGVWILRTTRKWLPFDLDVLRPLLEQMRVQGSDFLEKNLALAEEVRHTFADLDRMESELQKALKAVGAVSGLVVKYRGRLQGLCDTVAERKIPQASERPVVNIGQWKKSPKSGQPEASTKRTDAPDA